jgi:hypothetical protein
MFFESLEAFKRVGFTFKKVSPIFSREVIGEYQYIP